MRAGGVILAAMAQADGKIKPRPVVVLSAMRPFGDYFVCGVSTQLHHEVPGFDEILGSGDADYSSSGFKARSLIRLGYAGIVHPADVICQIGSISATRLRRMLDRLGNYFKDQAARLGQK